MCPLQHGSSTDKAPRNTRSAGAGLWRTVPQRQIEDFGEGLLGTGLRMECNSGHIDGIVFGQLTEMEHRQLDCRRPAWRISVSNITSSAPRVNIVRPRGRLVASAFSRTGRWRAVLPKRPERSARQASAFAHRVMSRSADRRADIFMQHWHADGAGLPSSQWKSGPA